MIHLVYVFLALIYAVQLQMSSILQAKGIIISHKRFNAEKLS